MRNSRIAAIALTALLVAFCMPLTAARASAGDRLPRFIDDVGLITPEQAEELTDKLDEISERHQFDTVIAVVYALDYREARLFAIDFFEESGFGFGDDLDGAILLLATQDRDFGFASLGFGLKAFTSAGQDYLDKLFLPQLKNDQYYEAFMSYAEAVDDFLTKAEAGKPYDWGNIPLTASERDTYSYEEAIDDLLTNVEAGKPYDWGTIPLTASERDTYRLYAIVTSLGLALVIAWLVTFVWKRQLVSVRREELAHAYIRSMDLQTQRDIFLYRHVQTVRRADDDSSSSSSGNSFTSSSGSDATGHSGKY